MGSPPARRRPVGLPTNLYCLLGAALISAACSSTNPMPAGPATLICSSPGEGTLGPPDMHCLGHPVQPVNEASCFFDAAAAATDDAAEASSGPDEGGGEISEGGGAPASDCDYGATMFGSGISDGGHPVAVEGDDDDCKYHVAWTSTPICESSVLGVTFTVTVTYLGTGLPVTDIPPSEGVLPEAFIPTSLAAACDDMSVHFSPTQFGPGTGLLETRPTSGVYVGSIIFDRAGEWTVRFHIHEECADALDDSPHGHAAFHITVP
jgi:hypothetical protein